MSGKRITIVLGITAVIFFGNMCYKDAVRIWQNLQNQSEYIKSLDKEYKKTTINLDEAQKNKESSQEEVKQLEKEKKKLESKKQLLKDRLQSHLDESKEVRYV